jgi:hypothetical protein
METDTIVKDRPIDATRLTDLAWNQLVANLLGVLITKMLPTATRADPIRT